MVCKQEHELGSPHHPGTFYTLYLCGTGPIYIRNLLEESRKGVGGAEEMAKLVKVTPAKPGDLSSLQTWWKEEADRKLSSDLYQKHNIYTYM